MYRTRLKAKLINTMQLMIPSVRYHVQGGFIEKNYLEYILQTLYTYKIRKY